MSGHHGGFVEGPIPGLPGPLPAGERLLWQGSPDWWRLAVSAFHLRAVGLWFALLALWSLASGEGLRALLGTLVSAVLAVGLLAFLARAMARATIYSITSRRVVMRYGVALEKCINIPFRIVRSAGLRTYADGTGDLPLALELRKGDRLGWAMLWPHARPWKLVRPEPMLRAVPDARRVAAILARALAEAAAAAPAAVAEDLVPEAPASPDAGPMPDGAGLAAGRPAPRPEAAAA